MLRYRHVIIALCALASAVVAGGRGDWNVFVNAGDAMVRRDGLQVFARHGDIQTGPVTLLAARLLALTPRNGFVLSVLIVVALGLMTIRTVERMAPRRNDLAVLIGGIIVMFWWAKLGGYGHLDDASVLFLTVCAICKVRSSRRVHAGLLIGLAIACKPWAVIFLPLVAVGDGPRVERLRGACTGLIVGGALWAPFLLGAPSTIHSIRSTVSVSADSVIALFRVTDANLPAWLRVAQLLGAMGAAALAARRGALAGVILAAVAVRVVSDPGTWSYYTAGFVVGAFVWDVLRRPTRAPWATIAASGLLVPGWIVSEAQERAVMRLVACVCALLVVFASSSMSESADQLDPEPVRVPARIHG